MVCGRIIEKINAEGRMQEDNSANLRFHIMSPDPCFYFSFVAPALARCDIGVRFSVRPSFRPQFTSTPVFKSIQMTFSL